MAFRPSHTYHYTLSFPRVLAPSASVVAAAAPTATWPAAAYWALFELMPGNNNSSPASWLLLATAAAGGSWPANTADSHWRGGVIGRR
eukprot:4031479-Lingulodinium_polyedra.AAC.1